VADPVRPILVLGGTVEGRQLATALTGAGQSVISSLAGRIGSDSSSLPPGPGRVGGFGGPDGLAKYLHEQRISAVIDATHPFAARITGNAVAACERTGTPLLVLRRPPWIAAEGDHWTMLPDLRAVARHLHTLSPETIVLLAIGRQDAGLFTTAPQAFWLRAIDPPKDALPPHGGLLLDRGPYSLDAELELLRHLNIGLLVTKNSGGTTAQAKLIAARQLGLPVLLAARPPLPTGVTTAPDVPAALHWARAHAPDH